MKKQLSICTFLIFTVFTVTSCISGIVGVKGNGNIVKEERTVNDFTSLQVGGAFTVYLQQGSPQSILIETDDNIIDMVITEVSGENLKINTRRNVYNTKSLNAYITVEHLSNIKVQGASTLFFDSEFDAEKEMYIVANGASSVKRADIKADYISMEATGASNINGRITCSNLDIVASGASDINLEGAADLKMVTAKGASSVHTHNVKSIQSELHAKGASSISTGEGEKTTLNSTGASSISTK